MSNYLGSFGLPTVTHVPLDRISCLRIVTWLMFFEMLQEGGIECGFSLNSPPLLSPPNMLPLQDSSPPNPSLAGFPTLKNSIIRLQVSQTTNLRFTFDSSASCQPEVLLDRIMAISWYDIYLFNKYLLRAFYIVSGLRRLHSNCKDRTYTDEKLKTSAVSPDNEQVCITDNIMLQAQWDTSLWAEEVRQGAQGNTVLLLRNSTGDGKEF